MSHKSSLATQVTVSFVWDKVVRLTHWSVVLIVVANWFFNEGGETAHRYLGYTAMVLIVLRLLWSLTGAKAPARFRDLIPTPKGFYRHFQEIKKRQEGSHRGHNAFGLLAVWLMWGCIIALGVTGILDDTNWGIDAGVSDWHEALADFLQIIVVLHIIAVILTSWWFRRNLVKSMR